MKVIVNGLAVEYQDDGNGPIMLLLHGWQDNLHTFDIIVHELAMTYRVIRIDLPGFGQSEFPKSTWQLSDYINFVKVFIEKLSIKVDVLIGYSFGGRIVIKGVAENVFNPKKIILIASAGISNSKSTRRLFYKFAAKIGKFLTYTTPLYFYRNGLKKILYDKADSDYMNSGALGGTYLKIISEDLSKYASQIRVPCLLIWGRDDSTTPLADGDKFSKLIKNSRIKIFDNAGHFVHQERAGEVIMEIKEFCAK
ncbi:MAG: alpha/beta superfamily hydrolase/acyltransferase [Parcubacteria group bacterium GW2011_GWA2_42_80]|uniref:Alpha/beta superfamily hydrolase/acyltransferase n=1 Tax=Candidatus Giovannonibacteria bacterium GW2011_GWF2_42_19 TaxID=1618659 RepID=A0A0G1BHV8_9BACT|nr:MAG: alpha/beta superfamily hydrolase/acyltransferase [Candidatus Giovannonibacteria bacterium GW2011_GWF2_42_19]KKS73817.1 MAG: alpha/beta superfamily hydrolase/acyltransferase [Parcubacteria group bacterium GW2011_GWA2_42_80]